MCVEWDDAATMPGAWKSETEVGEFLAEKRTCHTWGVIVKQDEKEIVLAGCITPGAAASVWRIPAGMVRKVYRLSGGPKIEGRE